MLTQSQLKEILHYDPDTGVFTWRVLRGGKHPGHVAGNSHHSGYIFISVNRRLYAAHRLAFLYTLGAFPEAETDHINGVRTDNRWANLRAVDRAVNMTNKKTYRSNTSGAVGVYWWPELARWRAMITRNGKTHSLGLFKTKEDAIAARKAAEIEHNFHPNHGRKAGANQ